jgi:hypothetical protein
MFWSTFDAGKLPVRFDEREQEPGPSQTGLEVTRRKPSRLTTGRLQLLRLFSTLLALAQVCAFLSLIWQRNKEKAQGSDNRDIALQLISTVEFSCP